MFSLHFIADHTIHISIPEIPRDIIVLYCLGASVTAKGYIKGSTGGDYDDGLAVFIGIAMAIIWPISVLFTEEKEDILIEAVKITGVFLLYVLLNGATPSLFSYIYD